MDLFTYPCAHGMHTCTTCVQVFLVDLVYATNTCSQSHNCDIFQITDADSVGMDLFTYPCAHGMHTYAYVYVQVFPLDLYASWLGVTPISKC
jgi:acyl dehydratase